MSEPGTVSGDEVDHLLELRWKLRQREDAEGALKLFCDIRLRMEQRHYLAFFRVRRSLENHLVASVSICPDAEPQFVPVARPLLRRSYPTRLSVRGAPPGIRAPRAAFAFHVSRDRSHEGNYSPWCHLARRSWLSCKPESGRFPGIKPPSMASQESGLIPRNLPLSLIPETGHRWGRSSNIWRNGVRSLGSKAWLLARYFLMTKPAIG